MREKRSKRSKMFIDHLITVMAPSILQQAVAAPHDAGVPAEPLPVAQQRPRPHFHRADPRQHTDDVTRRGFI
ncbi:unnamed protein product [Arctogadus glacialis]